MKRKVFIIFLVGLLFLVGSISTAIKVEEENLESKTKNDYDFKDHSSLSVMNLDSATVAKWQEADKELKEAFIDPDLAEEIQTTEDYSILDLLEYTPSERNQGACGNCWAWPSTALIAIELNIQKGIKDRLSVQFMNTCGERYTSGMNLIECCGGGTLEMLANFYENTNFAIPWSNTMAHWHDGVRNNCRTDCSQISKTPNYPIYEIDSVRIPIHNVPTEEAIENIKNVLHQQKGVYFSIMYPDNVDLERFRDMWRNEGETDIYDIDGYCGNEWNDEEAVGHAMLIYGYHDEEGTENDYWKVLNSWGTTDKRPNGCLAWEMHMNYGCKYSNYNAFGAKTLEVSFDPNPDAPLAPTITGPTNGDPGTEYTYEFSAVDPQGDDVSIYVKWDAGFGGSGWKGPYASGEKIQLTHTWDEEENVVIRARARDTDNNKGVWSSYSVILPRSKDIDRTSFDFFARYPRLYNLFEKLFELM